MNSSEESTEDYLDSNDTDTYLSGLYENLWSYVYLEVISSIIVTSVSSVTAVVGAISWYLFTKWRTYRNYVFLNFIVSACIYNFFNIFVMTDVFNESYFMYVDIYIFTEFVYNLWLLVMCIMFYSDVVKIYNEPVTRRFLKSALVCWGIPTATMVIVEIVDFITDIYEFVFNMFSLIHLIPPVIWLVNTVLYLRLLCSLARIPNVRRSKSYMCTKLQVATLMFLMSGVASFAMRFTPLNKEHAATYTILIQNMSFLPSCAVAVYIFISKCNRKLWIEYYQSRSRIMDSSDTVTSNV
jgi:hypothetical protein